ncbi:DUF1027 domain-containing protein [Periweissella cryptocerci]|uniref:DUF1027 domain-containing protein n=1 Tax=Periweissella cryptocerci TaxID=2506420 RepID=A0A4P6YRQ6_9LACO|nr:YutD family protein [Periweissella cryptocerci]QBO35310.1 DUF1027 domain-containing protein [Periweissella cryptocerci]
MDRETMKAMAEAQFAERAAVVELHHLEGDNLSINGHPYQLVTNYREAFDDTKLKARFSSILTKYNYIVGDISADQLRLKGFYEASRPNTPRAQTIDALEDYLYEYVNFGAPYFVLYSPEPFTSKDDRTEDRPVRPARQRVTNRPNKNDKKTSQGDRPKRSTRKPETSPKRGNSAKPNEAGKNTKPRTADQNKRPKSRNNGGNHEHREAKPATPGAPKTQNRQQRPRPDEKSSQGQGRTQNNSQSRNSKNNNRNPKAKRPEITERRKPVTGDNIKSRENQTAVSNNKPNRRKRSFTIRQKED